MSAGWTAALGGGAGGKSRSLWQGGGSCQGGDFWQGGGKWHGGMDWWLSELAEGRACGEASPRWVPPLLWRPAEEKAGRVWQPARGGIGGGAKGGVPAGGRGGNAAGVRHPCWGWLTDGGLQAGLLGGGVSRVRKGGREGGGGGGTCQTREAWQRVGVGGRERAAEGDCCRRGMRQPTSGRDGRRGGGAPSRCPGRTPGAGAPRRRPTADLGGSRRRQYRGDAWGAAALLRPGACMVRAQGKEWLPQQAACSSVPGWTWTKKEERRLENRGDGNRARSTARDTRYGEGPHARRSQAAAHSYAPHAPRCRQLPLHVARCRADCRTAY